MRAKALHVRCNDEKRLVEFSLQGLNSGVSPVFFASCSGCGCKVEWVGPDVNTGRPRNQKTGIKPHVQGYWRHERRNGGTHV